MNRVAIWSVWLTVFVALMIIGVPSRGLAFIISASLGVLLDKALHRWTGTGLLIRSSERGAVPVFLLAAVSLATSWMAAFGMTSQEPTGPVYRRATLDQLRVEPENNAPGYYRPRFRDADHDCLDTRAEVLVQESNPPAEVRKCKVVSGSWYSAYDGIPIYDPAFLQIDHLVALHQLWVSGAWAWPAQRYRDYANDLNHPEVLIAVTGSANRDKSDKDAGRWRPSNQAFWCEYAGDVVEIKGREDLSVDQAEHDALAEMLAGCTP